MLLKDKIREELEVIRQSNGGLLRQEDVVAFARSADTALHSQFTWDDGEAAEQFRLIQAAKVIRLQIHVIEEEETKVRAFVSLSVDRTKNGGYRPITEVMQRGDLQAVMLKDALAELNAIRRKYRALQSLSGVWEAVDRIAPPQSAEVQQAV